MGVIPEEEFMIFIIIAIIAVLVLWGVTAYNGLVKSRMQTKESWSQIDVQLKRRNDLIPNLIETVKGYAAGITVSLPFLFEIETSLMGRCGLL
jgi:LemA protein